MKKIITVTVTFTDDIDRTYAKEISEKFADSFHETITTEMSGVDLAFVEWSTEVTDAP